MRYYRVQDRPSTPCPEFEALGLGIRPYIPPKPPGFKHLPDWPRRDHSRVERGSVVLQWFVIVLLAGFVGVALVTPTVGGARQDVSAYRTD